MKAAFIGTGYVGLVTGTCLAEIGHEITCVDLDEAKIAGLRENVIPIYEPGLNELVASNQAAGRLSFTTDFATAVNSVDLVFVAVGTPQRDDGAADLKYVWTVIEQIREVATEPKVVVIKSTVPVGTNAGALERLNTGDIKHYAVSNPEFLREGLAVGDCLKPDRVVIGVREAHSHKLLADLYEPFSSQGVPVLFMGPESSEMTKYVANCVLATKISYINEMANMCEAIGADINDVRRGIGHDPRIGFQFFAPGVGYGGSCFPKDVRAMKFLARENNMPMRILESVDYVNEAQKQVAAQKLFQLVDARTHPVVGIWGLAFKPDTDDIREAPALVLIRRLLKEDCRVQVYDPEATENVREIFGDEIEYCDNRDDAAAGTDALVVMTEWKEFRDVDPAGLRQQMRGNVVVDGRNVFEPQQMQTAGFVYSSIGRPVVGTAEPEANEMSTC